MNFLLDPFRTDPARAEPARAEPVQEAAYPLPRHFQSIQACRGIAALLVLLCHLVEMQVKYGDRSHIFLAWTRCGEGGVDLFFAISGCVILAAALPDFRSIYGALRFAYHRITRIYPPYWVYATLVLITFWLRPEWVNSTSGHQISIFPSYLLIPGRGPRLVIVGWTLEFEIGFYAAIFLLMLLVPARRVGWILLVWAIAVIGIGPYIWQHFPVNGAVNVTLSPLVLEFLGGAFIYLAMRRFAPRKWLATASIILGLLAFAAISVFRMRMLPPDAQLETYDRLHLYNYGLPGLLVLYGATAFERLGAIRWTRAFTALGDWSYSLYLGHILVISATSRVLAYYLSPSRSTNVLILVVGLVMSIAVAAGSYRWMERPIIRFFQRRLPRRFARVRPSHSH